MLVVGCLKKKMVTKKKLKKFKPLLTLLPRIQAHAPIPGVYLSRPNLTVFRRYVLNLTFVLSSEILYFFTRLQSWTLNSRQVRNVAEKWFSADVPKVLIFGLLVRKGTINDFSYYDWVLGSYWHSYLFQANDHKS